MNKIILEKISRRRKQIVVHSIIYYRLCTSIIDDKTFDKWSRELVKLQNDYKEESKKAILYEEFKNFDGNTGYQFINQYSYLSLAERLVEYNKKLQKEEIIIDNSN